MKSLFRFIAGVLLAVAIAFITTPVVFEADPEVDAAVSDSEEASEPLPGPEPLDSPYIEPQPEPLAPLPQFVRLEQPVVFPVLKNGVAIGTAKAERGVHVDVVADDGATVRVRLVNAVASVPRSALVPAAIPQPEQKILQRIARPDFVQNIRDYWFPAGGKSVGLSAHEIGTSRSITHNWESGWGSYDRDYGGTKTLAIEVRNLASTNTGKLVLDIYWICRDLETDVRYPHYHQSFAIELPKMSRIQRFSKCPVLASNVTNYVALGKKIKSGAKLDGYLATVTANQKRVRAVASAGYLHDVLESPDKIDALLAAKAPRRSVAEY